MEQRYAQQIKNLQQEKDHIIETSKKQLQEKDLTIATRESQLRQLNQQLEANEQATADFQNELVESQKTICDIRESLLAKDKQIRELQQPTAKLQLKGQKKGPLSLRWSECGKAPDKIRGPSSVVDGNMVYFNPEVPTMCIPIALQK